MTSCRVYINPTQGFWADPATTDSPSNEEVAQVWLTGVSKDLGTPYREGYTFVGWQYRLFNNNQATVTIDGTVVCVVDSSSILGPAFYAQWRKNDTLWKENINQLFRNQGDCLWQIIQEIIGEPIKWHNDDYTQYRVLNNHKIYPDLSIIDKVDEGLWILDGSVEPQYKDNIIRNAQAHYAVAATPLPVISPIVIGPESGQNHRCYKDTLSIVWDTISGAYAVDYVITCTDNNNTVIYTQTVLNNTQVINTFNVAQPITKVSLAVSSWSDGNSYPKVSQVLWGTIEDSNYGNKNSTHVVLSSSVDPSGNSLPSRSINVTCSNMSHERTDTFDTLSEENIIDKAQLVTKFGQYFDDMLPRYTSNMVFSLNKYSAPSDSQELEIQGVSCIDKMAYGFSMNAGPAYRSHGYEDAAILPATLYEIIAVNLSLYTNANYIDINDLHYPDKFNKTAYATTTLQAIKAGTPINQVLQYLAQYTQCILKDIPSDNSPKIIDSDYSGSSVEGEITEREATAYPHISLNTAINKIVVKKYHIDFLDDNNYVYSASERVQGNASAQGWKYLHWDQPLNMSYEHNLSVFWVSYDASNNRIVHPLNILSLEFYRDSLIVLYSTWTGSDEITVYFEVTGIADVSTQKILTFNTNNSLEPIKGSFTWDDAYIGVDIYYDHSLMNITTEGPAHVGRTLGTNFAQFTLTPLVVQPTMEVDIRGGKLSITSEDVVYWDDSSNTSGETLTVDNPLVSTNNMVDKIGSYLKGMFVDRRSWGIDYLGDPDIAAWDNLKVTTVYGEVPVMSIVKANLEYNGGYSGTVEGRNYDFLNN